MAEHLASIFGTEKDRVNCPFYFKIGCATMTALRKQGSRAGNMPGLQHGFSPSHTSHISAGLAGMVTDARGCTTNRLSVRRCCYRTCTKILPSTPRLAQTGSPCPLMHDKARNTLRQVSIYPLVMSWNCSWLATACVPLSLIARVCANELFML